MRKSRGGKKKVGRRRADHHNPIKVVVLAKMYRVPRVGIQREHFEEMVKDAELKGFGTEPSSGTVRGGRSAGEALDQENRQHQRCELGRVWKKYARLVTESFRYHC